jgi:hypothetical protein
MPKNPNLDKLRQLRANPGYADVRSLHIAYCLLRGRTIGQIESAYSNPYTFPSLSTIRSYVYDGHRPGATDNPLHPDYLKEVKAFWVKCEADIKAWQQQLHVTWATTQAKRRARNAAKAAAGPRVHTSRPATLASRGA